MTIGAHGFDALEAMPLSALTASPCFVSRGIETVGDDSLETFERNCEALGASVPTVRIAERPGES